MRKSKFMKALLVFGMSAVTATSIVGFAACDNTEGENPGGDGGTPGGSTCQHVYDGWLQDTANNQHYQVCGLCDTEANRGAHVDADDNKRCDTCNVELSHTYETTWSKDDNGHWHAANCDHTTLRADEAAHTDDDADGSCDANCGYTYTIPDAFKNLRNKEGVDVLLANTFITSGKVAEYNSDNLGKTPSITSSVSDTNYTEIRDGAAYLVNGQSGKTAMYVDFGGAEGLIEGYFEVTPDASPSITPVQFFGSNGTSEIYGLRMQGGKLHWRLSGSGNGTAGAQDISVTAGTAFKVYFSFNTVDNTVTIKINNVGADDPVFHTIALSDSIKGIKFAAQDSGTASISVDNLIVVNTPLSLEASKTSANNKVAAAKAKIHTDITVNDTDIKTAFDTALAAATTNADCDTAYDTYYAALVDLYSDAVSDKLVADYPPASYTKPENSEAYAAAAGACETALTAADTMEKVTAAYTTADEALKVLNTNDYYEQATFTVTVSDGTNSTEITGLRAGDQLTKAQLDALVTVPSGQVISGYTVDGNPISFPYTVSGAITITATFETKVVNSKESFSTVAGSAEAASSKTFAANDVITENTLFTIHAKTDMLYSVGKTYGQINTGSNAASYKNLAGETVSPDQGIKLTNGVAQNSTIDAFTVTASEKITLKLYITWCNDSYNSNKSGRILSSINGGTVTETADLTARKTISVLTFELNAGDVLTIGGKNTHTDAGKVWFFGAEATLNS